MADDKTKLGEQNQEPEGAVVDTTNIMTDETFWDSDDLGDDFFSSGDVTATPEVSAETGIAYEPNPENFLNDDNPDDNQSGEESTGDEEEDPDGTITEKKPAKKVVPKVEVKKESKDEGQEGEEDELTLEQQQAEFFKVKAQTMIEGGVFLTLSEEDIPEDLDEEGYKELQAKELDNRVEQTIESWKSKLGDVGLDFVKFTMEGGKPYDFIKQLDKPDFNDMSIETEADQMSTVTAYLMHLEGKSLVEAQELVEFHKDKGRLAKKAEEFRDKAIKHEEAIRQQAVREQQAANREREDRNNEYRRNFSKVITELDSAGFMKINKNEKKKIQDFATVASEELSNGKFVTPLNKKLRDVLLEGGEKLAILSKLLMNDFKVEKDLLKNSETEVVKKVKTGLSALAASNTKIRTTTTKQTATNKRLADYL